MPKNAENVSVGKPAVAGAISIAPTGTALPTSTDAALSSAFKDLGYAGEDGVTNSNAVTSEQIKAWGGDIVETPQTEKADTFKVKLIEALNEEVLKVYFGSANVSGSLATGITVNVNSKELPESSWVIDTILRAGAAKRMVIPRGKVTELGDVVYKDNEVIGYEVTIAALPDSAGNTHYEYLKRTPAGTVTLDKTTATVAAGSTTTITATTSPVGGTVKWSVDDSDIATVTGGVVTGVAAGSCTVTARVVETGAVATCAITVTGG